MMTFRVRHFLSVYFFLPHELLPRVKNNIFRCFSTLNKHEAFSTIDLSDCKSTVMCGSTSDGSSARFNSKYRQRANIFVQFGAEQLTGDWLSLDARRVPHDVLHIYLPHTRTNIISINSAILSAKVNKASNCEKDIQLEQLLY